MHNYVNIDTIRTRGKYLYLVHIKIRVFVVGNSGVTTLISVS